MTQGVSKTFFVLHLTTVSSSLWYNVIFRSPRFAWDMFQKYVSNSVFVLWLIDKLLWNNRSRITLAFPIHTEIRDCSVKRACYLQLPPNTTCYPKIPLVPDCCVLFQPINISITTYIILSYSITHAPTYISLSFFLIPKSSSHLD